MNPIHSTRNLIRTAIERNDFLNNLMDKERKEMVINAMAPASYRKHSLIIREHEEGSEIYVSAEGQYDVIRGGQLVASFGPATVFGELAILYNAPRQASIEGKFSSLEKKGWFINQRVLFLSCHRCTRLENRTRNLPGHHANLGVQGARGEPSVPALRSIPAGVRPEFVAQSRGSFAAGNPLS